MDDGLTVYRLPRSHWHCTLKDFSWEAVRPAAAREHIARFLAAVVVDKASSAATAASHLILTGAPGIGKTHIGVAVYRAAAAKLGTLDVTWCNVPDFCEQVKRSYKQDGGDPWEDIEAATRLVVLDDLFGRDLSVHETGQIVYRLIDTVYRNEADLLVTMNQDIDELSARLAAHEISRLLADATVLAMSASRDWRR